MNKKLFFQAIARFVSGIILVAVLLFVPAGTIHYRNAWLLMGILFVPMFAAGIVLVIKNPDLLRKRLNVKEKESEQKGVIMLSGLMFLSGFIVAGLDYRFQWLVLPKWIVIAATILLWVTTHKIRAETKK